MDIQTDSHMVHNINSPISYTDLFNILHTVVDSPHTDIIVLVDINVSSLHSIMNHRKDPPLSHLCFFVASIHRHIGKSTILYTAYNPSCKRY